MAVRIIVDGKDFDDLPKEEQERIGEWIAQEFAKIKFEKLMQLIEDDDPRAEEYYQELVDCIVDKKGDGKH